MTDTPDKVTITETLCKVSSIEVFRTSRGNRILQTPFYGLRQGNSWTVYFIDATTDIDWLNGEIDKGLIYVLEQHYEVYLKRVK